MSACGKASASTLRDANAFGHDVDAGRHLGYRMLHLHARVHLDEEEFAVLEQELEGADALVADLPAGLGATRAPTSATAPGSDPGAGASSTTFWWRR